MGYSPQKAVTQQRRASCVGRRSEIPGPSSGEQAGKQATNIKHPSIRLLGPSLVVETLLDRVTKRLHSALFCLSNTTSHISGEPAHTTAGGKILPDTEQEQAVYQVDIPEHEFFQLLLCLLCRETDALMFLSPIIAHYSTTG